MSVVVGIVAKVLVGGIVTMAVLDKTIIPIVYVQGNSMFPTYKDGEFFLSRRVFNPQTLEVGDVVVLKNPSSYGHKILVKRIWYFEFKGGLKNKVAVLGDNEGNSYDSREFGSFPVSNIISVAFRSRPRKVV